MIEISSNISSYLTELLGEERAQRYFEFIRNEHTPYLRIGRFNNDIKGLINKLSTYGIELSDVPLIENAYCIKNGSEAAGKTLEFNIGKYYIQSLSSMIPPIVLSPQPGERVMDMCAAPGSKATQIAELMNNQGTFIANELSLDRVKMLVHNIEKMNLINTGILNYKGEWLSRLYNEYFDKILLDAPCSALGVIQKKEEVSNWWSMERVGKIAHLQLMLISAAIKMLKPGGEMVYSTCTLTPEENEFIIDHVLKKYDLEVMEIELPVKSEEGFTSYKGEQLDPRLNRSRRIIPWEVDSEGFFIVKLKKLSSTEPAKLLPDNTDKTIKLIDSRHHSIKEHLAFLSDTFGIDNKLWDNFRYLIKGSDIFFTDKNFTTPHLGLFSRIGSKFATIDKRGKAHLQSFAAQFLHNNITRNVVELADYLSLRSYFMGGIIKTENPMLGQAVVRYNNHTLGTASSIQGGLKSQYPKSKRIHEIKYF